MRIILTAALLFMQQAPLPVTSSVHLTNDKALCSVRSVDLREGLLYAGFGNQLRILQPAYLAQPTELGSLSMAGVVEDVDIAGSYAYVAMGGAGVAIVDIADPSQPVLHASLAITGSSLRVSVELPYVYVAAGLGGLRIIDVSNPGLPQEVGSYVPTESSPYATGPYARIQGIDVRNSTVHMVGESYFWAIDTTDPASPTLLAHVPTEGFATDVKAGDNRAYLVTQGLRLRNGGFGVVPIGSSPTPTIT